MMRLWFIAPIGLALLAGACGETKGQRAATGAGGGAVAGAAVGGPVGAVVGAGAGAATGAYRDRVDNVVDEQAENVSEKMRNGRSASQSQSSRSGQQASMDEGRQLSNDEVREAQTALRDMGLYNGEIDGLYGPQTINAVGEYQAQQNLPRTMALDDQTMQHLQRADAGSSAPAPDRQTGERPAEESGSPAPMGEPSPATP